MDVHEQLRLLKERHTAEVRQHEAHLAQIVEDYEEGVRKMAEAMDDPPDDVPTVVRMTAPTGEEIVVFNLPAFEQICMTLDMMADVATEMQKL